LKNEVLTPLAAAGSHGVRLKGTDPEGAVPLGPGNGIDITLWLFNIAMENDPFIDGLPIKNCDFPWLC